MKYRGVEIDPKYLPGMLDEMQDYTLCDDVRDLLRAASERIKQLEASRSVGSG